MKGKGTKRVCEVLTVLGLGLVAAAMLLTVKNIAEDQTAKEVSEAAVVEIERETLERLVAEPENLHEADALTPVKETKSGEYIAILELPSLGLKLPVQSDWSYEKLKVSPCRYWGSSYTEDLIIAAHNYSSHFGKLKHLNTGDNIVLTDIEGKGSNYMVEKIETVSPEKAEEIVSDQYALTLFTCTLGGENRVVVRCSKITE